jgi:2-oxoglutarate dehydrogenase E2 component (dihydrolipoamide succinyltransferase)
MGKIEMVMPKMGESVMEGTILKWLKKEGDIIKQDESVLEVATDKVDTDIPAPFEGVIERLLVKEGDVIAVGKPIAIIITADSVNTNQANAPANGKSNTPIINGNHHKIVQKLPRYNDGKFYSPLVRNIAEKENITFTELSAIQGTGKDGRVTKKDMLDFLATRENPTDKDVQIEPCEILPTTLTSDSSIVHTASLSGEIEIVEMDRMRKMISQRMVESKNISAHVTTFIEADMTKIVKWKNATMRGFMEREGAALTYTPVFIEAVIKALKHYPMLNISIDGDKIIKHKNINIGLAVALPDGNLIVPVIKNADKLNLTGLVLAVNDLAKRARNGKLHPDELTGGTYTVSNIGTFGNMMGTPILVQPQVGIMAFGAIKKKPAVIETPEGDVIGIRQMMFISHSYDHRVIDGALGGMFLKYVADYLEKFDVQQKV